jgi:hypothetical protein
MTESWSPPIADNKEVARTKKATSSQEVYSSLGDLSIVRFFVSFNDIHRVDRKQKFVACRRADLVSKADRESQKWKLCLREKRLPRSDQRPSNRC